MENVMISQRLMVCLLIPLLTSTLVAAEPERSITVTGEGKTTSPPDMAEINIGVMTQAATAAQALQSNNESVRSIMDVLKGQQIADKDMQTLQFNIHPVYAQTRGEQEPRVTGYQVINQLHVRVRNLPSLGQVLDSVVQAGSNQINGISFGIDNQEGVLNQARNRAIHDARARAELYAQVAGVNLGKVLSIQESGAVMPPPQPMMRMAAAESVPIATGEQELSASVSMTFELLD
jgi:uncharacterized protein YggE